MHRNVLLQTWSSTVFVVTFMPSGRPSGHATPARLPCACKAGRGGAACGLRRRPRGRTLRTRSREQARERPGGHGASARLPCASTGTSPALPVRFAASTGAVANV